MNNLTQNSPKYPAPKSAKTTPKQRFAYYIAITVVIFVVSTLIVTSKDETLDEFSVYEGRLTELKVTTTRRDVGQPATPIMVFTVEGLNAKLGIGQNAPADFSIYTNNLNVGDKIKVYYAPRLSTTPEGYNPYVIQLEKDGVALLDINDANKSYKRGGYVGLGLGILALLGTTIYYRRNVAKNSNH
jgi:hypothetical protein